MVAGYQGVDAQGNITTLGRGASDLTAVALAAALKADVCEIYTDVDGVYTADPNIVPTARKLDRISYDEMLEMAGLGAKVLQLRSVELARRYNVPLVVRSSFSEAEGTWVRQEDSSMEDVLVSGVTLDQNQAKVTIAGVEDRPGLAAKDFWPDRGRRDYRGHDYSECGRRRPRRHDVYRSARRAAPRARDRQAGGRGNRRRRYPPRGSGRESLDRRARDAHPRRRCGDDVPRAGRRSASISR